MREDLTRLDDLKALITATKWIYDRDAQFAFKSLAFYLARIISEIIKEHRLEFRKSVSRAIRFNESVDKEN